ncbi:Na+/H+ antiporter NhaC [Pelagibius sp. Alg239-R121]|uniref:Na+/H+ antiporter NhaC n=1 Tax=Pelagibius sp. Alg239-R121 TaxID=2993448 RepID=UPI0024A6AA3B|nr:Na+/H+ antiporter NhaC [Pelagibius sp. Alg239-R121]
MTIDGHGDEGARAPLIWEAALSMLALVIGISVSIAIYGTDPHVPMLIGVIVACLVAWRCGFKWETVQSGMLGGITNALQAIVILLIIGILIGTWILAGVVPSLIYYGLQILSPSIFLPTALLLCALTSLATGTSWGTSGTIGVALIGIGSGLGLPLPVVAGAVLSGAYFGDKMSPLSDTTNMAPAMAGTDLYTHIKHMSYTTGVAFGLTLIIEIVLSIVLGSESSDLSQIEEILVTLDANFLINPIMLIPPALVMVVSFKKVPAIPGIAAGALAAIFLAVLFQGASYSDVISVSFSGFKSETNVAAVDELLSRGGLESMLYTISLVIVAMMFGGIMERTGQLRVLAAGILQRARSTGSLIASTALTGIGANMLLCDQYMAIVMTGRTYAEEYRNRGLHPKNLSRAVEDSATVTANLVPWNSGGAFQTATLGVATLAYLPFNFFCWLSPIVTITFGVFGWTIHRADEQGDEAAPVKQGAD